MKTKPLFRSKKIIMLVCGLLATTRLWSIESSFIVKDINVVGLKRVALGTVLNYLPIEVGEELSRDSTADIIKSLYDTGFFQAVTLERDQHTLVISVTERATIGDINIEGNLRQRRYRFDQVTDWLRTTFSKSLSKLADSEPA